MDDSQTAASFIHFRRLRVLLKSWGFKRRQIQTLHHEIGGLGPSESLKPSLFRRWVRWMEQLGQLQEKERDILSEIVSIEKKHAQLRRAHVLRKADQTLASRAKKAPEDAFQNEEAERPHRHSLWLWLLLFFAFDQENRRKKDSPKNG